ncbi:transporter [uncultured Desulfovibrio sp.]|uniref:SphA family protein n=1 Tax=uncultured Desulfovibrio sp. TaxID=167968 RepID=UPI002804D468|nr:transporter [uncultured Desulfovibrio sp.]
MRFFCKMMAVLCLLVTACWPAMAQAGLKGHWSPGLIGIRACTVPQHPGLAYKLLLHYQEGNSLREDSGKRALGKDHFKAQTLAASHRFLWTPDVEKIPFLGAQYNFQLIVPMIATGMEVNGSYSHAAGIGDIYISPVLLSWDVGNWQWIWSVGLMAPTGYYDKDNSASIGKGFWSPMMTAGMTWWVDEARTWSFSGIARYEKHTRTPDKDLWQGDDFSFEWGLGKMLDENWEIGLVGFSSFQVTPDRGDDSRDALGRKYGFDAAHGIGVELGYTDRERGIAISISPKKEFAVYGRPEGWMVTTSFSFAF